MIRVLLVDDERLVCAHLRAILSRAGDLEVVGEAYDGAEAVEACLRLTPDVVLMDIRMPGVDGLTAAERICGVPGAPKVIMLTTFDVDEYAVRALRAGAVGFLLKDTDPEDLIDIVRVGAEGHAIVSPALTRRLINAFAAAEPARDQARSLVAELTEREREVLTCLGQGLSNAQIGGRLFLSETTVKGHVSRLLAKLRCANRTQAALLAYDAGLVSR
ncbi:response regulator [Rhizohabitans arisaemae]|uniref:response regulator n=1 Tax=Rhizohabitans arisaemae TaxID=2720610 RepID=UPI0024B1117B|nr:response regulator transcription factor [Rhizohabitans arisaemae]